MILHEQWFDFGKNNTYIKRSGNNTKKLILQIHHVKTKIQVFANMSTLFISQNMCNAKGTTREKKSLQIFTGNTENYITKDLLK